jgi:predicted ATPase
MTKSGWKHRIETNIFPQAQSVFQFITERWQLLDENFMPPLAVPSGTSADPYVIDRCADNLPLMMEHMYRNHKSLYDNLQDDLRWLTYHVSSLEPERTDVETRVKVFEEALGSREAPTISAGTSRLLGILTAFYALDMRSSEMPGLVVIEEPDTALNPGIIRNFVEQIRTYVVGYKPRQVIMTTHNPRFLDYFKPEEVRVVERDEQGYTSVHRLPDHIQEVWLDKYTLGEVWMTNSFGALAE